MARSFSLWVVEKGLPWCIFWLSVDVSCGSGAPSQGAGFLDCAFKGVLDRAPWHSCSLSHGWQPTASSDGLGKDQ